MNHPATRGAGGRRLLAGILIAAAAILAPAAGAQDGEAARRLARPDDEPPLAPGEAEDLQETLEIYMLAKMKRELELTRPQEEQVVPRVQELSEVRRRWQRERRLAMAALLPLVEDPNSREGDLTAALERLARNETTFRAAEARIQGEIRAVLTPRQQGKFLFFQERFRREVLQRLRQARGGQGPGPGGPGPRGPRRQGPGAPPR